VRLVRVLLSAEVQQPQLVVLVAKEPLVSAVSRQAKRKARRLPEPRHQQVRSGFPKPENNTIPLFSGLALACC
jgi:hypothetical protein